MLAQELGQRHQDARGAEAALQPMMVLKRLLQRVQPVAIGERFDRGDLLAVALHREHQAGARARPAEEDRARAACAVLASDVRAGEVQLVAQKIHQREACFHFTAVCLAVHRDGYRSRISHWIQNLNSRSFQPRKHTEAHRNLQERRNQSKTMTLQAFELSVLSV
jgi:hypothetical protein